MLEEKGLKVMGGESARDMDEPRFKKYCKDTCFVEAIISCRADGKSVDNGNFHIPVLPDQGIAVQACEDHTTGLRARRCLLGPARTYD